MVDVFGHGDLKGCYIPNALHKCRSVMVSSGRSLGRSKSQQTLIDGAAKSQSLHHVLSSILWEGVTQSLSKALEINSTITITIVTCE